MSETATATETPSAAGPFTAEMITDTFGADAIIPDGTATAAPEPAKSEPAPETVEPRVAERIAANKRAEIRAAREREELASHRATLAEQKAAQDKREAELKLIEDDPAKYFELKKLGTKAIADHLEKLAGTYTPEAQADKKLSAVEQELADIKAKLAAKENAEREQTLTVQQREAEQAAGAAWLADVSASVDKYPHLTKEWNEQEAVHVAFAELRRVVGHDAQGRPVTRVAAFERDNGRAPTHDEIAEYLDGVAKARIEARGKASWGKTVSAPNGSQPATGEQKSAPTVMGSSPRTLSTRDTSQRAAAPRSIEWSQERADEESLRILMKAQKR